MFKDENEIVIKVNDQKEYILELNKFRQKYNLPITFRSTIKPIKFPTKITMTKKVSSYECWFDY